MTRLALIALATLAACGRPAPDTTANASVTSAGATEPVVANRVEPAAAAQDRYLGRWTGVEGTMLVVAPKPGGGVTLDMQYDLDNRGTFDGSVTAEGLRFVRNGVAETAVFSNGDATGLKWLAGKKDCLTVKPGEGYCRD